MPFFESLKSQKKRIKKELYTEDCELAKKCENVEEQILFWKSRLRDMLQIGLFEQEFPLMEDYQEIINEEIKYLEEVVKSQFEVSIKHNKKIQPIWWKGTGRQLRYLMDELARLDLIDRNSPVNKHCKELFINMDKEPFTDSIKQNSSGATKKPKGHEQLDQIIKETKEQRESDKT